MKFSEFVGYETKKKIIKKKKIDNFYFGFGLNKNNLKRVHDYIKSWFVRYHIKFQSINPYLTLYILNNIPKLRNNFINEVKSTRNGVFYSSDGDGSITLFSGDNNEIWLEYEYNDEYSEVLESIFDRMNINIISKHCYVRMFTIDKMIDKMIDNRFLDDMMYSCPKFPHIYLNNVGLLKRR